MKTAVLGFVTAALLLASALAHGLIGWPAFHQSLSAEGVDATLLGALAVGWYFGSAAMLAFAFIVASQAVRRLKGRPVDRSSLGGIAVMYLVFGSAAFVLRDFNPHFLLFVVTGVLVGAFGLLCARADASA